MCGRNTANQFAKIASIFIVKIEAIFISILHEKNIRLKKVSKVLPPWFVHGLSMVPPSKTPKSMDKPWTNHGGTMDKPFI